MSFAHLHNHSHYSLLDGLPKIPQLVKRAKEYGCPAIALTDHGNMYGAIEFYKTCKKEGIKPIIGLEAYLAFGAMSERKGRMDDYYHLTLLAKNEQGYRNLMKLVTISNLEGFYYKPRIDKKVLREHSGGLIALSGCLGGEICQLIVAGRYDDAKRVAEEFQEIFGKENFFGEVQCHPEIPDQAKANDGVFRLCDELGMMPVATLDSHYIDRSDAEAQDVLVCVQTGKFITDTGRLNMTGTDLSFKNPDQLREEWKSHPEVVSNTLKVAELCNLELDLNKWNFPRYPLPEGKTSAQFLYDLIIAGAKEKLNSKTDDLSDIDPALKERIDYEFDVITKKGYDLYFLVVSDYIKWARAHGIVTTTRGSAAGSMVSYLIDITTVNPMYFQLPFERFLTIHRPSPPDVDGDFADNRRDEVIAYIKERYGADKVAQIVTFGTMLPRAAVRDVTRVLGYPYSFGDRISKMIPPGAQGFHMTVDRAIEENPDLKKFQKEDERVKRVLDLARKLEGCVRHASVHAAGIVISPTALTDFTPLQRESQGENIISQYDMYAVEMAGLLKMDILGIRNLSILGEAIKIVKQIKNIDVDINNLPLDDKEVFSLLSHGHTMGVFQLSGSGMTRYLKELKPTTIHDIMAMVALYRPGPLESIPEYITRKHNPKLVKYMDPRLKPILERTFGILVYQDDVLLISIRLAGYTWEEADKLRKAMGKKIPAEMAAQKEKFLKGCVVSSLTQEKAQELWTLIEPFAAYGFNKAHAASYAMVAYQTAYMKAHFPAEFITAILTAEAGNEEKIAEVIAAAREEGITVLPPDINESFKGFTYVDEHNIRFGLLAIKNMGEDVVEAIITARGSAPFKDLEDFLVRAQHKNINKKSLESLAKAGAMDRFGDRALMLENMETMLAFNRESSSTNRRQSSLFGASSVVNSLRLREVPPASKQEKLQWELALLGLYVSSHPLDDFRDALKGKVVQTEKLTEIPEHAKLCVAGVLTGITVRFTKSGEKFIVGRLQDLAGSCEVVAFPKVYTIDPTLWQEGAMVFIWGRGGGEEKRVVCERAMQLTRDTVSQIDSNSVQVSSGRNGYNDFRSGARASVNPAPAPSAPLQRSVKRLVVRIQENNKTAVDALRIFFQSQSGSVSVFIEMGEGIGRRMIATQFKVEPTDSVMTALYSIVGTDAIRIAE